VVIQEGRRPLFTSDQLDYYPEALWEVYGVKEDVSHPDRQGRLRKSNFLPQEDLNYAQVVKKRRKGRIVSVVRKVVFGIGEKIKALIEKSSVSKNINTAFVERSNGTLREFNRRLTRKTHGFSKKSEEIVNQLNLF